MKLLSRNYATFIHDVIFDFEKYNHAKPESWGTQNYRNHIEYITCYASKQIKNYMTGIKNDLL